MSRHYLLKNPLAAQLYESCAKDIPIIDYHNHLVVQDILFDRRFENITQLWITTDPYKHRAMRILGIPERYITGDASDFEKFEQWYLSISRLAGTPLYDWSVMEFELVFDITLPPFHASAEQIWRQTNEKLQSLTAKKILEKFNIEYCAPCASLCDDLSPFTKLFYVSPSLRGDDVVAPDRAFLEKLSSVSGAAVPTLDAYMAAVEKRIALFYEAGCRFTDHALDDGFRYVSDDGNNEARFQAVKGGQTLAESDRVALSSRILRDLGRLYAKYGLAMQLHIGAKRTTSTRLRKIAGPAGGYAGIGRCVDVASLTALLDDIECAGVLPKTVLFTLNPADNAVMSALSGSYSREGMEAVVSQGPAWWWCDHAQGIREMLDKLSAYGVLSTFIGMTTDSRSLLSFARHDYFRRILCQWIAEKVDIGHLPEDMHILSNLVSRMCYENAKKNI